MAYVSMEPWNSNYKRFKKRVEERYPGYVLDGLQRISPGPNTKTVDFGKLWDVLISSDEKLLEEHAWIFSSLEDSKFLTKDSERTVASMQEMVAYCSYPRCGNSFLRKYLQNITGIATGSDMSLEFNIDL